LLFIHYHNKSFLFTAVQNERQPRNTATIRPEMLLTDSNSERLLREGVAATVAAVFAGQFGATPTGQSRQSRAALVAGAPDGKDLASKKRKFRPD